MVVFLHTPATPRVVVLSAEIDRHDAEICFGRYLARLAAGGSLQWEHRSYEAVAPQEMRAFDLGVFCRPRFDECPALLEASRRFGIPSLVMIDDHWIAAGEDYPERFKGLFTAGDRPLQIFLEALRIADLTVVYSSRLAADLAPLARRLLRFPLNIDLSLFPRPVDDPRPRVEAPLLGYAGSPRIFETTAFRALARLATVRPEVSVLVFSHRVPEELAALPRPQLLHEPFRANYFEYAATLARLAPDVLLAPLDATRAAAAKCPVKALDAAAVGAAGVFSRVAPYTDSVCHGDTGLLVEESESAWFEALQFLVDRPQDRARLAHNAALAVRERFSTDAVLPRFRDLIWTLLRRDWSALPIS